MQAAGYHDLLCRQPDSYVHHGELRYENMGLIEFSFSAAALGEIVSDASEESCYIDLSYDTKLKLITENDTTKTSELPGAESTALLCQREVGSHRLRIQTRIRNTIFLRNIITVHDFGWLLHHRESTWVWIYFLMAVHHRWRRMFLLTGSIVLASLPGSKSVVP